MYKLCENLEIFWNWSITVFLERLSPLASTNRTLVRNYSVLTKSFTELWRNFKEDINIQQIKSSVRPFRTALSFSLSLSFLKRQPSQNFLNISVQSLCNACGIRQRKARRAMEGYTANPSSSIKAKVNKAPKTQHKKRCKLSSPSQTGKKRCFEDFFALSFSKISAFPRVFPQDEQEGAILLMALSCGLVHSWMSVLGFFSNSYHNVSVLGGKTVTREKSVVEKPENCIRKPCRNIQYIFHNWTIYIAYLQVK